MRLLASGRWRFSMSVTGTPSAENIDAYSMPMTLPPTTGHRTGHRLEPDHVVARDHDLAVGRNARGRHRVGPDRDDDLLAAEYVVDLGEQLLRGGACARCHPGAVMAGDPAEESHGLAQSLLGIVPVPRHTPPRQGCFPMMAARLPSLAAWTAARCPAGPLPMHTRS